MSMLAKVKTGPIEAPELVLVYAKDGLGKTTLGTEAPSPFFLGTESGLKRFPHIPRVTPETFDEALQTLDELTTAKHEYKTLVVDSVDWLEPLCWDKVCRDAGNAKNIEAAYGGYGKGYVAAVDLWRTFLAKVAKLQATKGMHVILLAHAQTKTFNDPHLAAAYDRIQLKMHEKSAAVIREFVDCVLYMTTETLTVGDTDKKVKALGEGKRVAYTDMRPGFDAKNRQGLPYMLELPLGMAWETYYKASKAGNPEDPKVVRARVEGLLANVTQKDLVPKIQSSIKEAGDNAIQLIKIQNRLLELVNTAPKSA